MKKGEKTAKQKKLELKKKKKHTRGKKKSRLHVFADALDFQRPCQRVEQSGMYT